MQNRTNWIIGIGIFLVFGFSGCKVFDIPAKIENNSTPNGYAGFENTDTVNSAQLNWRKFFNDPFLVNLIDTALGNNQELNIMLQEIEISKNEIRARKGEYLPFVGFNAGAGFEREGRYTRNGAVIDQLEIAPGKSFQEPVPDYMFGAVASWELDIWKKLRNAKKSAVTRYLSTVEGRNFMLTHLISEIARSYYELMALDNQLSIIQKNSELQTNALNIILQEKAAAKVSQLAVNRFEAQLLNTRNLQYEVMQRIVETENRIYFLTGKFPEVIPRSSDLFIQLKPDSVLAGVPAQLLANRPDIRQAELNLMASRLDLKVARANFYPSFSIRAAIGFQAFNPRFLLNPESMLYNLAGDVIAPIVNRNAIKAIYLNANAKQIQSVFEYERTILSAYLDLVNQLSQMKNYSASFETKAKEVEILTQSIPVSTNLFRSARADYMEVLLTQRDALESRMQLVEIKLKQLQARINIYQALGGGWS